MKWFFAQIINVDQWPPASVNARNRVSQQTLHQRLRERGLLASVDRGRQMVQVRRTLEGRPRQVLHLKAMDLEGDLQRFGDADQNLKS